MGELRPMPSCLVTNQNEKENSYEVQKLSSTSPLLSTTAINQNNKQQLIRYSIIATWVMYTTSLVIKFRHQYCCSYTENHYLAYYGYSKLIMFIMTVHELCSSDHSRYKKKTQTSITTKKIEEKCKDGSKQKLSNKSSSDVKLIQGDISTSHLWSQAVTT